MDVTSAAAILEALERSPAARPYVRQWLDAAVRYSEIRVAWLFADPDARKALDPGRSAAHDVFIDECNVMSRAMAAKGEANAWRAEIGLERREIGDFACILHAVLGLRAG